MTEQTQNAHVHESHFFWQGQYSWACGGRGALSKFRFPCSECGPLFEKRGQPFRCDILRHIYLFPFQRSDIIQFPSLRFSIAKKQVSTAGRLNTRRAFLAPRSIFFCTYRHLFLVARGGVGAKPLAAGRPIMKTNHFNPVALTRLHRNQRTRNFGNAESNPVYSQSVQSDRFSDSRRSKSMTCKKFWQTRKNL